MLRMRSARLRGALTHHPAGVAWLSSLTAAQGAISANSWTLSPFENKHFFHETAVLLKRHGIGL